MASFHLTRKFVSRGQGQSVVATAAYISRSNLYNEQDGLQKNYTRKGEQELLESFIYAPKDAPEWVFDREKLWNAAEHAENLHNKTRKKSAITGQHIDLALPHELDPEQTRRLLQDFVRDNFTRPGFVVDVNIHSAERGGDQRNKHAHILVTMRKLEGDQFSAQKDQINRTQLREQIKHWRENWAKQQSRHLERAGFKMEAARMIYGHKKLEEQQVIAEARGDHEHAEALKREATQHEGATATQMKREGKSSRIVNFNKEANDRSADLAKARAELKSVIEAEQGIFYANTPQGKLNRLERVHDWQRDRLTLKQEREKLQQQDAHAWQNRDEARVSPVLAAWNERERARQAWDLEQHHKAEAAALVQKQTDQREAIAAEQIWYDHAGEIVGAQPDNQRHQIRQGKKTKIRNMDKSAAQQEAERQQADYYNRIKRDQREPTEEQKLNRELQAELRRQEREAERAINQTARQEPPPQQKTRAELRDEELKQTRGQRMTPPRRPKRPDGR